MNSIYRKCLLSIMAEVFVNRTFCVWLNDHWSVLSGEMVICPLTSDIKKRAAKIGSPRQFSGIVPSGRSGGRRQRYQTCISLSFIVTPRPIVLKILKFNPFSLNPFKIKLIQNGVKAEVRSVNVFGVLAWVGSSW